MADRSLPRWALLSGGALIMLVVLIVTLRSMASSYLESEEFRGGMEQLATDLLREIDTELKLRVPQSRSESCLAVRLGDLQLVRRDKPVVGLTVRADLDVFPSALAGRAHFAVSASLMRGGQIKLSGALPLRQALGLLLDGELPRGVVVEASAREVDAHDLIAIWPSLAKNPRLNLVGGRLAGSFAFGGGQKTALVTMVVGQTDWRAPALGRISVVLPPWSAELKVSADTLATVQPIRLQLPMTALTVRGSISFNGSDADLDLMVGALGGMLGRVALAKLLACQRMPQRDDFTVKGSAKRPVCQ